jgi:hypothetical protein
MLGAHHLHVVEVKRTHIGEVVHLHPDVVEVRVCAHIEVGISTHIA